MTTHGSALAVEALNLESGVARRFKEPLPVAGCGRDRDRSKDRRCVPDLCRAKAPNEQEIFLESLVPAGGTYIFEMVIPFVARRAHRERETEIGMCARVVDRRQNERLPLRLRHPRTVIPATDGQRFVMLKEEDEGRAIEALRVVLNWTDELKSYPRRGGN